MMISLRLSRTLELGHIGSYLTKTGKMHYGEILIAFALVSQQEITHMGLNRSKQAGFPGGFGNI
jgi:hypothetical protein